MSSAVTERIVAPCSTSTSGRSPVMTTSSVLPTVVGWSLISMVAVRLSWTSTGTLPEVYPMNDACTSYEPTGTPARTKLPSSRAIAPRVVPTIDTFV